MPPSPIIGLCSSYNEGQLAIAAVRDLSKCCDRVLILEGPIGETPNVGEPTQAWTGRKQPSNVFLKHGGPWATDAAKRTALLKWAQAMNTGACWGVTLDADEIMPWAEYLPDYIRHSESRGEAGGVELKVCFEDGQVYTSRTRCFRIDTVESYLISSVQLQLKSGLVWACALGFGKTGPLHGEPHVLHRGYLRSAERGDPAWRMSKQELEELARMELDTTQGIVPSYEELLRFRA